MPDRGFVVAYDDGWPDRFAAERDRLVAALGSRLVDGVHHIGSTAIPGMPAKPIIDMMAGVADLEVAAAAASELAPLGYRSHPHRVDAVLYVGTDGGADTHHLHLTTSGSRLWVERLAFRDALRADDALAQQYRELKRSLVSASGSYTAADKREFVRRVLAGAGVELRDGMHTDPR